MSEALLVFAKAPWPGRVKTRLTPDLDAVQAAAVHEASLRDVIARVEGLGPPVHLFHDEAPGSAEYFARAFPDLRRSTQAGGDLGRRLENALDRSFAQGSTAVAVLGADSPTLPPAFVREGFTALREAEVIIGPTADGGYYLIGVSRAAWPGARELFRGIPWSTDRVLACTLERVVRNGLRHHLLEPWYDIDQIDDLRLASLDADPDGHLAVLLESWHREGGDPLLPP